MSHHLSQFRVYFPKDGTCHYTTGFNNGKPVILPSLNENFLDVYSSEIKQRFGEPILQCSTGEKDKNRKTIYEGDVVYLHKLNLIGIVVKKNKLVNKPTDDSINFWLQTKTGICSLFGSNIIGEIMFQTDKDYSDFQK
jgi:uncharacterized phage protein (TIGR01671 family)